MTNPAIVFRLRGLTMLLAFTAGRYYNNGPAFAVGPLVGVRHRRWLPEAVAFDLGWGWDHETPVSAWPVLRVAAAPSPGSKNRRTGLYWLGFYTSVCWGAR